MNSDAPLNRDALLAELDAAKQSVWTRSGSVSRLYGEASVAKAIKYTKHGQGPDLPEAQQPRL